MSHGNDGTGQRRAGQHRRSGALAALLTAVAALAAASVLVALPAQAAPLAQQRNNGPDLSVSPSSRVPATNAEVTVRGSGYNGDGELWVAVCQDDGVAPEQFAHCLGGAIPNSNGSSAWAVITPDGNPRYAGPVNGAFSGNGKFKVTLQIPVAVGQDADCVSGRCSVYTRSADPADRSQDASAGIRFSAPRTSSATAPTTEVIGGTPSTVAPDSIAAQQLSPGEEQTVVFSGFTPKEAVDVTLYSDPITLPAAAADGSGVVTVAFTVPPDLPLGEHLIQAVGRSSGLIGVASFAVVEPLASTTEVTETTESTVQTTESAEASDDPLMTILDTPESTASPDTSAASELPTETAQSATDDVVATGPAAGVADGGNRLLWLWIMLIALVVIGGAAAAVALMMRRRREFDDGDRGSLDGVLGGAEPGDAAGDEPAAPSWEDLRAQTAAPQPAVPQPEVPQPEWPLFGGAEPDPAPVHDGGPATEQFRPVFADDDAGSAVAGTGAATAPADDEAVEQAVDALDIADARDYLGDDPAPRRGRHSSD